MNDIPSLRVGFEYQGQQHYEPVEFFGGEEAFRYRQKLDALKLEKCRKNGVKLLYWNYKDAVTKRKMDELKTLG